jgi:hypothetical protein
VIFLQVREKAFDDIAVISKSMDFATFDCGNDDFNDYIKHEALEDQEQLISIRPRLSGGDIAFGNLQTERFHAFLPGLPQDRFQRDARGHDGLVGYGDPFALVR